MKIIEKWKNRETKKKLREENIRLKAEIEMLNKIPKYPVCTEERSVQKVRTKVVYYAEEHIPVEEIKRILIRNLSNHLSEFVDYDFVDNKNGELIYSASLYVATGYRNK